MKKAEKKKLKKAIDHIKSTLKKAKKEEAKARSNYNAEIKTCKKKIKPVFAVCSGGLQPTHVPALVKMFGKDIIIQAGGGVHGNPLGTRKGSVAMRQAIDAVMKKVPLKKYAKGKEELSAAIKKWGIY